VNHLINFLSENTFLYYHQHLYQIRLELLLFNAPEVTQDEFGTDVGGNIEMYFQRENLSSGSLNFYPETGDIVDWNKQYWEINGITEPQLVAGHPEYNHSINATAHKARLSSLQIEERPK
jgi:hypothetical protein